MVADGGCKHVTSGSFVARDPHRPDEVPTVDGADLHLSYELALPSNKHPRRGAPRSKSFAGVCF